MPTADQMTAARSDAATSVVDYQALAQGQVSKVPYTYLVAENVVPESLKSAIKADFPDIRQPGFVPLDSMTQTGTFEALIKAIESPEMAAQLSDLLGVELRDKPKITTIRKWSQAKDGRIHNDGESKIVTALIYLNEEWKDDNGAGDFTILNSDQSFDDCAAVVPSKFGTLVAFVRDDKSWHGHKPFVGERRVVQTAWLRSQADYDRKQKRGHLALFLKNLLRPGQKSDPKNEMM